MKDPPPGLLCGLGEIIRGECWARGRRGAELGECRPASSPLSLFPRAWLHPSSLELSASSTLPLPPSAPPPSSRCLVASGAPLVQRLGLGAHADWGHSDAWPQCSDLTLYSEVGTHKGQGWWGAGGSF